MISGMATPSIFTGHHREEGVSRIRAAATHFCPSAALSHIHSTDITDWVSGIVVGIRGQERTKQKEMLAQGTFIPAGEWGKQAISKTNACIFTTYLLIYLKIYLYTLLIIYLSK